MFTPLIHLSMRYFLLLNTHFQIFNLQVLFLFGKDGLKLLKSAFGAVWSHPESCPFAWGHMAPKADLRIFYLIFVISCKFTNIIFFSIMNMMGKCV